MRIFQCGFLANGPGEPSCSSEIANALPVAVSSAAQLANVHSGGWGFALASTSDGKLYAWGVNQATLLGKSGEPAAAPRSRCWWEIRGTAPTFKVVAGSADDGAEPSTMDVVAEAGVEAAAGGFDHGLVVVDGTLSVFGPHMRGPPGTTGLYLKPFTLPVAVAAVAAGEHHSLVLTRGGGIYGIGSNREGQLGVETGGEDASVPVSVVDPSRGDFVATAIAAGARHSVSIDAGGRCWAWGWSLHGQCATGAAVPSVRVPTMVAALGPLKCVSVAAGMAHTLCCTDHGDVYAWGGNGDGQLGDASNTSSQQPQLVEHAELDAEHVVKVAAGARHSLALCKGGGAFAWGYGKFGQLGTGSFRSEAAPRRMAVPEGSKVSDVAAGWWHSLLAVEEIGKF